MLLENGVIASDKKRRWIPDKKNTAGNSIQCHDDSGGGCHFGRDKTRYFWHGVYEHLATSRLVKNAKR